MTRSRLLFDCSSEYESFALLLVHWIQEKDLMTQSAFRPTLTPLFERELSMTQRLAIWLIRRLPETGAEQSSPTSDKIFIDDDRPRAHAALNGILASVQRTPLSESPIRRLRTESLSPEEVDFLSAMAEVQHYGTALTSIERWGWPAASDTERVLDAVTQLADCLDIAGHRFPCPKPDQVLAARPTLTTMALDQRELALVKGVRAWAWCFQQGHEGLPVLDRLLRSSSLVGVLNPLDRILINTSVAASRQVDLRYPSCAALSQDEARIVHAISACQRDHRDAGFELLESWLQPAAVRLTLPAVEGIALALTASAHRLPLRRWRFPELTGSSSWPTSESTPVPALH